MLSHDRVVIDGVCIDIHTSVATVATPHMKALIAV
jgi:hypothetical protein